MNIKKKLSIIIPSVVILIGIVFVIIGFSKGASKDYKSQFEFSDFEANLTSGGVYNLDINVGIANLNVISTNDINDFNIEATGVTKDFIEYSTSNNTLKLRYNTQKWYQEIFVPGYKKNMGTVNLYVPASVSLKDVQIQADNGDLNISYITADNIYINCSKNNNHIKNLTCNYAEINNNGENINAVNINAVNADLNLDSGSAVFSNFSTQSLVLNNDGDLKISGMITGDSTLKSDGGDVEIILYGEESDYSFKVIEGDVTVNGKDAQSSESSQYYIEAMGDISIDIK